MGHIGLVVAIALSLAAPAAARVACVEVPTLDDACERWVTGYDHTEGHVDWGVDQAVDVAVSPAGDRVYVVGHSNDDSGLRDIVTLALSADSGDLVWVQRFAGPRDDHDFASAVAVSSDGGTVFVAGTVDADNGPNRGRGAVVAYDAATGEKRWSAISERGGPDGLDRFAALAPSPGGALVYAVGSTGPWSEFGLGLSDYLVVAYDAGTGVERWSLTYDGPSGRFDRARDVAAGPDGGTVFVTGTSDGLGDPRDYDSDLATLAIDAQTGAARWVHRHDGGRQGNDGAEAVAVSGDGSRIFVAGFVQVDGYSASSYSNYAAVAVAVDAATGEELWAAGHAGPGEGVNAATSLAVAGDSVVVAGHATGSHDLDWDPFATGLDASTGERLWLDQRGLPGATFEAMEDVGASPDGRRVHVTGFSRLSARQDVVTVAYEPDTGDRVWTGRWNSSPAGINYDLAGAVAATDNGAFVAATTGDELAAQANRGNDDFSYRDIAVLAYH